MLSLSTFLARRLAVWALLFSSRFTQCCTALTVLAVNDDGPGTSACADSGLDWYIKPVGETPCKTYERLRQICNSQFIVGTMNSSFPPDVCHEDVGDCCCNSVAFALSMLCLNCQKGTGTKNGGSDAPAGTYEKYLTGPRTSFCSPVTNNSLPTSVQSAVCASGIHIMRDIYSRTFWRDGVWFYTWSREDLTEKANANASSIYGLCPSPSPSSTGIPPSQSRSSTLPPQSTSTSSSLSNSSSHGSSEIATIVLEVSTAVLLIAFLGTGLLALRLWKRSKREILGVHGPASHNTPAHPPFVRKYVPPIAETVLQRSYERKIDLPVIQRDITSEADYHAALGASSRYTSEFDRSSVSDGISLSATPESERRKLLSYLKYPFSDLETLSVISEASSGDTITSVPSSGMFASVHGESTSNARTEDMHLDRLP